MKKILLGLVLLLAVPLSVCAQSSMTDSQVAEYVQRESAHGSSQAQIVTHLMQSGVDISQIRRVRRIYEQKTKGKGLGNTTENATAENRLRQNNGKAKLSKTKTQTEKYDKQRNAATTGRIQGTPKWQEQYDEDDQDFLQMQQEVSNIMPVDTAKLLKQLLDQQRKDKHKVFGRDIFSNKNLSFEPIMNIATPQSYRLGPGDAVNIDIYGASQRSITATVSPDGDIVIENFGPIHVGGLSVAQATARIRSQLGARYQSSRIKLSLGQTRTVTVNVMGEVVTPGTYTLSAFASVFNALYMAGGTNDLGTLRNIKIYRHNRLISVCDIYDYILNGKMTGNVRLNDGDVIIVGPYDCLVNITGKVKRPMYYEMKRNESIETLLRYAGGFTGDAYKKAVRVNRKTGREYAVYNVEEFDMSSFRVAFRPGMYQLGAGINSVRTLIQHAEGLTEQAFTARAVIHRMNADRTLRVIAADIEGIMSGRVADIPLKENDVLFIPTKEEAMTERTITINGEVHYPGIYKYADNETLEDFVLQAGGLKETASTVKVDVARRVSDPKALTTDSIIAKTYSFALKDGFVVDGQPGFVLQPYDEVYVRRSPAYSEQQNVTVDGKVMFPGTYAMAYRNMRLTDLVKMAGGVAPDAYIKGARIMRVPTEAERTRMEAAFKMQQEQLRQQLMQLAVNNNNSMLQNSDETLQKQLEKFQVPNTYPVGIELDKALKDPKSDANIVLRAGDRLLIPSYTATVKINGAVMYPNTVSYERGESVRHYLDAAGGFAQNARKSGVYIIYMNGMVGKVSRGAKVEPGCEIVVPSKLTRKMTAAEYMSLGSSLSSIAAMIATIANMSK